MVLNEQLAFLAYRKLTKEEKKIKVEYFNGFTPKNGN